MKITVTDFEGLIIIEPEVFTDSRGYFMETYSERKLEPTINSILFVQDNEAKSVYGVIRGLHYQLSPKAQCKLVRCTYGEILDVVIDLRPDSDQFGKVFSIVLSAENKKQLFIPKGFAHGYSVISPEAVLCYKCDDYYSVEHEKGILFDDPELAIDWQIPLPDRLISAKDKNWPIFEHHYKFI
ncbi:MAG: dTDP-4-dehydrorhamnose 3,5-epimerase [Bacteroidota bacterium]|nr:dTDP-4-dehydrorhamnose 3,5-epimerase [Bacteroidota bacterium]